MKNTILFLSALVFGSPLFANTAEKASPVASLAYNNAFIFVENGITFSVYPDGEFDFYIEDRVNLGAQLNLGRTDITFNSGFNYDPYVQYDHYGAVIQVENVPVYYDYYGRVSQIGDVDIRYNSGRVHRLGGLYVHYYSSGVYSHCTGFVNVYNRHYVYRPYHGYFLRPAIGFALVYHRPYRRYYSPVRYTYYSPYQYNNRRVYAIVGNPYKYDRKNGRESIYRNDKRVVVRENNSRRDSGLRSNTSVAGRNSSARTLGQSTRNQETTLTRTNSAKAQRSQNTDIRSARNTEGAGRIATDQTASRRSVSTERKNTVQTRTAQSVIKSAPAQNRERSVQTEARSQRTVSSAPARSNIRQGNTQGRSVSAKSSQTRTGRNTTVSKRSSTRVQ